MSALFAFSFCRLTPWVCLLPSLSPGFQLFSFFRLIVHAEPISRYNFFDVGLIGAVKNDAICERDSMQ